jgi:transcriptional regulator with XRE-family HTH domain
MQLAERGTMSAVAMARQFSPAKLQRLRLAKGWTEQALGEKAGGLSRQQISNLERPLAENSLGPHAKTLSALAEALGVKIDRLFED